MLAVVVVVIKTKAVQFPQVGQVVAGMGQQAH
jgi:hypothetical protein